jgi:hypothetical protein
MSMRSVRLLVAIAWGGGLVACGGRGMSKDAGRDLPPGQLEGGTDTASSAQDAAIDAARLDLAGDLAPDVGGGDVPLPPPDVASDETTTAADAGAESSRTDAGCGAATDPRNCGSCGHDCTQLAHVRPDKVECRDGACVIASDGCFPGFAHCSSDADAGCETDITRSERCGSCTTSCRLCATSASGQAMCVDDCAAAGLVQCAPRQAPFERHCVDLQSNRDHCGACGAPCLIPGAEANCVAGQCVVEKCAANRADCDPVRSGCETALRTFSDCRGCGDSCAAAHATGTCQAAGCTHLCDPGFGDCAPAHPDCETPLDTAENCGACGNACPPDRPLCGGSRGQRMCAAACSAPTGDRCGSSCTDLATDPLHCGACNTVCASYQICVQGRCSPRYVHTDVIADSALDRATLGHLAIAIGPDGSYVVGGFFEGSVDFDPGPGQERHQTDATSDLFITKFNADGGHAWTRTLPASLEGLAVAADGSVVAGGYFGGSVDFDPGPGIDVRQGAATDPFILKLGASGGLIWARTFAAAAANSGGTGRAVAVGADGAITTTGTFGGRVDFDPGTGTDVREAVTSPQLGSPNNMYVVKLTAAGNLLWARTFTGQIEPATVAVHPTGGIWIGGAFVATPDFDPGAAVDARGAGSTFDAFAERLDPAGNHLGVLTIDHGGAEDVRTVAFDGDGSVYVGGSTSGNSFFLRKLTSGGSEQWSKVGSAFRLQAAAPGGGFFAGGSDVRGFAGSIGLLARRHDASGDPLWTIPTNLPSVALYRADLAAAGADSLVIIGYQDIGGDYDPGPAADIIMTRGLFITRYAF